DDPSTALNTRLLDALNTADLLLIAGEASSHCVRATTEHIVQNLPRLQAGARPGHIVLLTDCMSPVGGFEAEQQTFLNAMRAQGVRLENSSQIRL
ncbi:MAG: cysteine hydrolase, partial [Gammaproteobacteria bacterium]|nr:cysteine hydrolase [Gammaproteobacteria bacterium]